MRLTLRTLLAYLDDTLEPAQAKVIGQKVAESDTAQELIARIKQVTRRRRLTTPPESGPGSKIDANTIAEYIDNALAPEQMAEVEQIFLASDVHLAEVAACHQILTLVLGEPSDVPAAAKQRMYGLVKGPEAIPYRKPQAATAEGTGAKKASEPAMKRPPIAPVPKEPPITREDLPYDQKKVSTPFIILGAGIAIGLLLAVAVWQLLSSGNNTVEPDDFVKKGNGTEEKGKKQDTPKAKGTEEAVKKKEPKIEPKGKGPKKVEPEPVKKIEPKGKVDDKKGKNIGNGGQEGPFDIPPDFPPDAPTAAKVKVGNYAGATLPATTSVLLQKMDTAVGWQRLSKTMPKVESGRQILGLPGSRGSIDLKNGLRMTLWGSLFEYIPHTMPGALLKETVVELHSDDKFNADLTLLRGRILLENTNEDRPVVARIRYTNPSEPDVPEFFDITLVDKGAKVIALRIGHFEPTEPFYRDRKAARPGPTAQMGIFVVSGKVYVRLGEVTTFGPQAMSPRSLLYWNSRQGEWQGPRTFDTIPNFALVEPPLPPNSGKGLQLARKEIGQSLDWIGKNLGRDKQLDVLLTESLKSDDRSRRRLAVRCFGAIGDLSHLHDALSMKKHRDVRYEAVVALRQWIASSRDNEYRLFDFLQNDRDYTALQAEKFMDLLHDIDQGKNPPPAETLGVLIEMLDNPSIVFRELAYFNLLRLDRVGKGRNIPYSASAESPLRQKAQAAWSEYLKSGKTPASTSS